MTPTATLRHRMLDDAKQVLLVILWVFVGVPITVALLMFEAAVEWVTERQRRSNDLLRIRRLALEVFEDEADAETWLSELNPALGNRAPLDVIRSDDGVRAVKTILGRIAHGIYS